MRLNKFIAHNTGISRREADDLIVAGKVLINGDVAILGQTTTNTDEISVNGKTLNHATAYKYVLLNKPVGYVCSKNPQGGDKAVYELLPEELQGLKTVGRLDKNSRGLIMLTNDGDLTLKLTHPKFKKEKTYHVVLDQPLNSEKLSKLKNGVKLGDGVSFLKVTQLADKTYEVKMTEGRNRQIRRTFEALGHQVDDLKRMQFGDYTLNDLREGSYMMIDLS